MAPWIAEDTMLLRLEAEEERETDADKQIAHPEGFGVHGGEDMIHPLGGEIIDRLVRDAVEHILGVRADIEHTELGKRRHTQTSVETV